MSVLLRLYFVFFQTPELFQKFSELLEESLRELRRRYTPVPLDALLMPDLPADCLARMDKVQA